MNEEQRNAKGVANALIEALPYVQRWAGHTVVVKLGGAAMKAVDLFDAFAQDIVLLRAVDIDVVLVHGGGAAVSDMGRRLGLEPKFVDGLRVTDDDTMRVAQLVQMGGVNRDLLAALARHGGRGVGLSGHDGGGWLHGRVRDHRSRETGEPVDLGRVGDITSVDTRLLRAQLQGKLIPVVAPIAVDEDLHALNVNADTVATAVAVALGAARLLFLTDVEGLHDPAGQVATGLDPATVRAWMDDGTISGGMVPKAEACLAALEGGVERVSIVDGRVAHATLIELLTEAGIGTMIELG